VVLVALAAAFWFWRRKHNKKKVAELTDVEGVGTAKGAPGSYGDRKAVYMTTAESSPQTQYGGSAIEEGGVMTALATGNRSVTSHHTGNTYHAVHPLDGEIHEIDTEERIHELPEEERYHDRKNVYDSPASQKF
jgi:hypothetical protein